MIGRLLRAGLVILVFAELCWPAVQPKRVLLLHSFGRGLGPLDAFAAGFRLGLERDAREPVEFYELSLALVGPIEPSEQSVVAFLSSMFDRRPPELIVAMGGPASMFAHRYRQQLFPATPLLMTAVDERPVKRISLTPTEAVVAVNYDAPGAVENIRRVLPKTSTVFVVIGNSPMERFWREELDREFQRFQKQLTFVWWNDLSFAEMLKRSAALPPNSVIFYPFLSLDAAGFHRTGGDALAELHAAANAPIFGLQSSQMGQGIVGGPLMSIDEASRNAAAAALRILNHESPENIRVAPQPPGPNIFDWRELRSWHIDESLLPGGSIVRFREPTPWQRYKWYVLASVLVSVVEALLIWSLLANLKKRRRAEESLRESRNRLGAILETAGEGIITVDEHDFIQSVNPSAEKMFGYAAAEMIGQPVSLILPTDSGLEIRGRRKDGARMPVELEQTEIVLDDRRSVTYFVRDITERKRAEQMVLEHGKQLLRAQEGERARLARELHDDITQRLARLAVDSGRIEFAKNRASQNEPMHGVHQELVRLSEDVHTLAYRLHPSLLDRLGLANALKVECDRFSQQESTRINVKLEGVPRHLHQDIALCLFRVTQEALRNVGRHARAASVVVSVHPSDDGLLLTVADNGVGFRYDAGRQGPSLGLASMHERVRLLQGRMTLRSEPGRGTTVEVWVPLKEQTVEIGESS